MKRKPKLHESELIASFNVGDEKALTQIFDLHYQSLHYFAIRLVQDGEQAEDIISDCFFKLWQNSGNFHTLNNIKAFLYISCRNACLNYLKQLKRRDRAQELYFGQLEHSEDTILFHIIETEVLDMLSKEIGSLPDKCQEVFKLIYFENKKTDEIADQLGISVKTVRGHKARGIELLKSQLLKKGMTGMMLLAFLMVVDKCDRFDVSDHICDKPISSSCGCL